MSRDVGAHDDLPQSQALIDKATEADGLSEFEDGRWEREAGLARRRPVAARGWSTIADHSPWSIADHYPGSLHRKVRSIADFDP